MKVLAMYLPQYHAIKENDEWWGKGYTEWTAVKKAVPYYKGHIQPKIPLNDNYYDLSDESADTWKWQAKLAKEHHVYGFCIYHYWFETGKQLLEKPMEILLNHPEIDINYCVCWANESWTRTWYGLETELLMEQKYGDEVEWKNHFTYLLKFFKDPRYIKIDNRPVVNIYHTFEIEKLKQMRECWDKLAIENGFSGVFIVSGNTHTTIDDRSGLMDAYYNFEPGYTFGHKFSWYRRFEYKIRTGVCVLCNKIFKRKRIERRVNSSVVNKCMMKKDEVPKNMVFPGAYPQWDNTPRRLYKGMEFHGTSIQTFRKQIVNMKSKYNDADLIYINAWNEWGEGCYLEPDVYNRDAFLKVIQEEFD